MRNYFGFVAFKSKTIPRYESVQTTRNTTIGALYKAVEDYNNFDSHSITPQSLFSTPSH